MRNAMHNVWEVFFTGCTFGLGLCGSGSRSRNSRGFRFWGSGLGLIVGCLGLREFVKRPATQEPH